ncbi:hypothetical protein [Paracoccus versutus]
MTTAPLKTETQAAEASAAGDLTVRFRDGQDLTILNVSAKDADTLFGHLANMPMDGISNCFAAIRQPERSVAINLVDVSAVRFKRRGAA